MKLFLLTLKQQFAETKFLRLHKTTKHRQIRFYLNLKT